MRHFFNAFRPLAADFLSTIIFVAIYTLTGSVTVGIALGIATGIGQIAWLMLTGKTVTPMQWASLALVIVLGSASLMTADPRFVMIKPSVAAFAIGFIMLRRGWLLRYLPPIVVEHVAPGILGAGIRVVAPGLRAGIRKTNCWRTVAAIAGPRK